MALRSLTGRIWHYVALQAGHGTT